MDRHSIATNTNGHNHLMSSLQHAGRPNRYRQALFHHHDYDSQNSGQDTNNTNNGNRNTIAIVFAVGVVVLLLLRCLYRVFLEDDAAEAATAGDGEPPQQHQQQEVGLEMAAAAPPVRQADDQPPLVCTYRKEDGWREGSCGVCLADLADGEALRVLPACMHYFHEACVGEWLRIHANCPLCRAPLVATVDRTA